MLKVETMGTRTCVMLLFPIMLFSVPVWGPLPNTLRNNIILNDTCNNFDCGLNPSSFFKLAGLHDNEAVA